MDIILVPRLVLNSLDVQSTIQKYNNLPDALVHSFFKIIGLSKILNF